MPSIVDLFKNQPYQSFGNKTAEEVFEVRNSKDIEITSTNGILNNTSFKLAKRIRENSSIRLGETRIEQEETGVRIIRAASEPILYGTQYGRILKRSTNILDSMKNDAVGGDEQSNGILGNLLNKVEEKGKNLLGKLGVNLPDKLIPTKIKLNDDFKKGIVTDLPKTLSKIKKDGQGNFVGNLLKDSVSGTPKQIGNQLIGNAIGGAKDAVRSALFGKNKSGENLATANKSLRTFDNGNGGTYSNKTNPNTEEVIDRNDLSTVLQQIVNPVVDGSVSRYAFDINNTIPKSPKQRYSKSENILAKPNLDKIGFETKKDFLNNKVPYYSEDGSPFEIGDGTVLDDYDFVTLKFFSLAKKTAVNFRATISGLSETISPSWQSQKTIGNPFSFYTYDGMERSVQFTFKIYSLNQTEHLRAWERLNFLTSLTYPQSINRTYTTPPFLKFTLGDWYKNKECFIDSLSYTVDDNTPWDIQTDGYKLPTIIEASITLKFVESVGSIFRNEEVEETVDGKTKKVSKLVMNRLYGFGSQKESVENEQQKSTNLNADSSAKPENTTVENKQVADGNSEKKVENPIKETPPPPTPKGVPTGYRKIVGGRLGAEAEKNNAVYWGEQGGFDLKFYIVSNKTGKVTAGPLTAIPNGETFA
jgi:hypothetical protein